MKYAKQKRLVTTLTTNGTISETTLRGLSKSLDILSVSVDHYDDTVWDDAKHVAGISKKAKATIKTAKAYGMDIYAITFLNPAWEVRDVERIVRYVNEELSVSFAMSYPYVSSNDSTFIVGGNMRDNQYKAQRNVRDMVAKVLQMKLLGSDVITVSCYLRDVLRAHDGLPMHYPCKAGETVITIDCNLNVFPCYKQEKLFNLREQQNLSIIQENFSCDNKNCLINCFKEASLASKKTFSKAIKEEFFSNPKFYLRLMS